MKVSVIIPVFNTEKYVEQCVRSCMIQEEVGQILVINDGSTDGSLQIINKLAKEDTRIKIYHHHNKLNLGAGPSRNLGINKASCEFINFLDSDDYYFEKRFNKSMKLLEDKSLDGVYESILVLKEKAHPKPYLLNIFKMANGIAPENGLDALLRGNKGSVQISGFTYRSEFIRANNIRCTILKRAQELNIIFESLIKGSIKFVPSKAVGAYRLHETNSVLNNVQGNKDLVVFYDLWFQKMLDYKLGKISNRYFFKQRLHYDKTIVTIRFRLLRNVFKGILAIYLLLRHPSLLFKLGF